MLIINNEVLNPKDLSDKKTKDFLQFAKEFREEHAGKRYLRYIRNTPLQRNKSGLYEPVTPILFPRIATVPSFSGAPETWIYTETMPSKKEGMFVLREKSITLGYEVIVSLETQMDYIYWLENNPLFKKYFKLDDPAAEHRMQVAIKRKTANLTQALYADNSPLSDDDKLKDVASAWGIPNVKNKEADTVRIELEDLLKQREAQKAKNPSVEGIDEFMSSLGNIDDEIRKRALLRRGVDSGIIEFDRKHWYYVIKGQEEEEDIRLVFIPMEQTRESLHFKYFCKQILDDKNAKLWKQVKSALINAEFIDGINKLDDIRWICREEGISTHHKALDTLKDEVKAAFGLDVDDAKA